MVFWYEWNNALEDYFRHKYKQLQKISKKIKFFVIYFKNLFYRFASLFCISRNSRTKVHNICLLVLNVCRFEHLQTHDTIYSLRNIYS